MPAGPLASTMTVLMDVMRASSSTSLDPSFAQWTERVILLIVESRELRVESLELRSRIV
jgi:hypothetical protein